MRNSLAKLVAAAAVTLMAGSAFGEDRHENHMHQNLAKEVDAFHAVLGPLWHARPGKERSQEVCANADKLGSLAKDIRTGDVQPLLTAIAGLAKQCQANPTDIDAAFSEVHEAFHRLVEAGMH